jgi:hypothetical protein
MRRMTAFVIHCASSSDEGNATVVRFLTIEVMSSRPNGRPLIVPPHGAHDSMLRPMWALIGQRGPRRRRIHRRNQSVGEASPPEFGRDRRQAHRQRPIPSVRPNSSGRPPSFRNGVQRAALDWLITPVAAFNHADGVLSRSGLTVAEKARASGLVGLGRSRGRRHAVAASAGVRGPHPLE